MKKQILYSVLATGMLAACTSQKKEPAITFAITNPIDLERAEELVAINYTTIKDSLRLDDNVALIILDAAGKQVPYQVAADGQTLLFPATVGASATAIYTLKAGTPETFEATVFGKHYPERVDDIAWENEYSAYRLYGPALQASGERAFGYDVWTKSVSAPVVDERYNKELGSQNIVDSLKAAGKQEEAAEFYHSVSYHVDHGNGLDCYKVGPTLGGGTAALYDNGKIIYPYCYKTYEIVENGPLRFTVHLTYNPTQVGDDMVTEHRVISAMKGSRLNYCSVFYEGLNKETQVATGLVIHPENTDTMAVNAEQKYIAYADLTDNVDNGNGVIYVGAVCPTMKEARPEWFTTIEAKKERGGATGHVLAIADYLPNSTYEYYFGSGWSKGGMPDMQTWETYLSEYSRKLGNPLQVKMQ